MLFDMVCRNARLMSVPEWRRDLFFLHYGNRNSSSIYRPTDGGTSRCTESRKVIMLLDLTASGLLSNLTEARLMLNTIRHQRFWLPRSRCRYRARQQFDPE